MSGLPGRASAIAPNACLAVPLCERPAAAGLHRDDGPQARGDDAGHRPGVPPRAAGQRRSGPAARLASPGRTADRPATQAWQSRNGSMSSTVNDMSSAVKRRTGCQSPRLSRRARPAAEIRTADVRPAAAPAARAPTPAGTRVRREPGGRARPPPRPAAPPPRPARPGEPGPGRCPHPAAGPGIAPPTPAHRGTSGPRAPPGDAPRPARRGASSPLPPPGSVHGRRRRRLGRTRRRRPGRA